MAADERKKSIMEHLARSSGNFNFQVKRSTQRFQPPTPVAPPVPEEQKISPDSRKKGIMEHLSRSTGNYSNFSVDTSQRKQKVMNHIRITRK
jgi:hypothetical protein